jgi:hypothetical protein
MCGLVGMARANSNTGPFSYSIFPFHFPVQSGPVTPRGQIDGMAAPPVAQRGPHREEILERDAARDEAHREEIPERRAFSLHLTASDLRHLWRDPATRRLCEAKVAELQAMCEPVCAPHPHGTGTPRVHLLAAWSGQPTAHPVSAQRPGHPVSAAHGWPAGSMQLPHSAGPQTHYFCAQDLMCAGLAWRWGLIFSQASLSGCPFLNCLSWGCCLPDTMQYEVSDVEANCFADALAGMPAGSRSSAPAFWYNPALPLMQQLPDSHVWRGWPVQPGDGELLRLGPQVIPTLDSLLLPRMDRPRPGMGAEDLVSRMDAVKAHFYKKLHAAKQPLVWE